MSGVRHFELAIDRFLEKEVPEKVALVQRVLTQQILRGVVFRTAVDKGQARGGWQVSLESAAFGQTGRLDKDGGATIAAAQDTIARIKPFSISFVQNNVGHIVFLDGGSSQQFPAGILDPTIATVEAQFA